MGHYGFHQICWIARNGINIIITVNTADSYHCRTKTLLNYVQIAMPLTRLFYLIPANFLVLSHHFILCRPRVHSPSIITHPVKQIVNRWFVLRTHGRRNSGSKREKKRNALFLINEKFNALAFVSCSGNGTVGTRQILVKYVTSHLRSWHWDANN